MFNVYPVEITYTSTASKGVLAGVPCHCVIGVESDYAGRKLFDDLIKNNPDCSFTNFKINKKK